MALDQQEMREKVIMMADSLGLVVLDEDTHVAVSTDDPRLDPAKADPARCWLDASTCPYGYPEGRFDLRPVEFCRVPEGLGSGCHKMERLRPDLEYAVRVIDEPSIREYFDGHRVSVSSELRAQAEEIVKDKEGGKAEEIALLLAADILKAEGRDRDVLLEDDLPDEIEKRKAVLAAAK